MATASGEVVERDYLESLAGGEEPRGAPVPTARRAAAASPGPRAGRTSPHEMAGTPARWDLIVDTSRAEVFLDLAGGVAGDDQAVVLQEHHRGAAAPWRSSWPRRASRIARARGRPGSAVRDPEDARPEELLGDLGAVGRAGDRVDRGRMGCGARIARMSAWNSNSTDGRRASFLPTRASGQPASPRRCPGSRARHRCIQQFHQRRDVQGNDGFGGQLRQRGPARLDVQNASILTEMLPRRRARTQDRRRTGRESAITSRRGRWRRTAVPAPGECSSFGLAADRVLMIRRRFGSAIECAFTVGEGGTQSAVVIDVARPPAAVDS